MSYIVLARKHRPQSFDNVIGQEHITDILKKSIKSNRVAHAYLFCGPRGVGKTTCARILSMCLNCEGGPKINPSMDDVVCQEIAKGTSFDVIEIDGASNRGIDEIRTVRENVKFAPSAGRYKIYIVDEVHMLTTEAFNALLKTLEEPPEHVKFIFATTAPNKVPATIISRTQRFDFKRIPLKTIVAHLQEVSKKEKFKIDEEALYAIAKAAQGSMRDALSILDQLSALSEKGVKADDVFSMLGLVETEHLFEIADFIGQKDCSKALKSLEGIIEKGKDIRQLAKDLTEHFRNLMVIKVGGKSLGKLVDYPVAIKEMYLTQTKLFSLQEILRAIKVLIEAQETARITESMRMPLEVAIAHLTYTDEPVSSTTPSAVAHPRAKVTQKFTPMDVINNKKGHLDLSSADDEDDEQEDEIEEIGQVEEMPSEEDHQDVSLSLDQIKRAWDSLTHAVSKEKMSVATYLQDGAPIAFKDDLLTIGFPEANSFQKEAIEDMATVKFVQEIFSKTLKVEIRIQYKIAEQHEPSEEEGIVQDALDTFQGKVVSRWHNE